MARTKKKAAKKASTNTRTGKELQKSGRVDTQGELDGVIERNPEVEEAAESYREARDERMGWNDEESKRKKTLLELMRRHKLMKCAVGDDHIAERLAGDEDVKVRKKKKAKTGLEVVK